MRATISTYEKERGKPMPSRNHSIIQNRLNYELTFHYGKKYDFPSELTLDLPNSGKPTPDICIYPKLHFESWLDDEIRVKDVPLCTIEILSPKQNLTDLTDKIADFFADGVKSCWLVVPNFKTIHVFSAPKTYRTFSDNDLLKDEALGIELPLEKIFYIPKK